MNVGAAPWCLWENATLSAGRMAERTKATVLKTVSWILAPPILVADGSRRHLYLI